MYATLAVALGMLAAFYTITDTKDDADVILHVTFDETTSRPSISVQLSDTVPLTFYPGDTGEWDRTMRVPPGMRVILSVTQETKGYSECSIMQGGRMAEGSPHGINGPGSFSCQHVAW